MHIESLKIFSDLVETESFTVTAQINRVTQPAVTQQINSLERVFKSRLIERSKKHFRLTREGDVLYRHGKQILHTYASLDSQLQEMQQVISGAIRVAAIYSIGLHILPSCLKQFMQSYPTVNVHVEYCPPNQVYDDVARNIADLGLVAYPVNKPGLVIVPLSEEPLVLVCHPRHPFARQSSLKLTALEGHNMVSLGRDMPTRKAIDEFLREYHVNVRHILEFDNVETVKRAVEIDSGISILPQSSVAEEVQNQALSSVAIENGRFFQPLAAIYKSSRVLSPAMKRFLACMKADGYRRKRQ